MNVCVCWSGGKNSTRAVIEHFNLGHSVTAVCYIPMFDDETPLISLEHYEFILNTADYFRSLGITVIFLKGVTYYDWCKRILKKGKFKGLPQGFPFFIRGKCGFARDGKIYTINKFLNNCQQYDFVDIGLCANEFDRKKLLGKEISILQNLGITDDDCFYWCRSHSLLSPKYNNSIRDGCVLCPHAKRTERLKFFQDFPKAFEKVIELQRLSRLRGFYPLRGRKWFIENDEFISFYGNQISCLSSVVIN